MSHDGTNHGGLVQPKYRADIDGLRAVAVLPVVAFHAFPHLLTGGFIGVDIFFVISGFLISTIIFENIERGSFSFADFYARRVRRIFPALSLVLLTTLLLGWALLFTDEFRNVGKHVATGSAFVANFGLWQESGYFDAATTAKPLVHLWSLGVEEQFYIFWPLLVWLAWRMRTNLMGLVLVAAIASFCVTMVMRQGDTVGMFFSPLSRFWELLAGAGLAWLARRPGSVLQRGGRWQHVASVAGLALIGGGVLFMSESLLFPGAWAMIPVAGAMLLIAAGPTAVVNRWVLANPVMVWFGLISYPLYLWHWPFLSYAWIVYGAPEAPVKLVAVALSILLAWLTFRFIEKPVRKARGMQRVAPLATAVALLFCAGVAIRFWDGTQSRLGEHTSTAALVEAERAYVKAQEGESCRRLLGLALPDQAYCVATSATPRVLVVGDSHASALFAPLFPASAGHEALLIGSNGCDLYPNLSIQRLNSSPHGMNCQAVAQYAIEVARSLSSVETVVIAQAWPEIRRQKEPNDYFDGDTRLDYYGALPNGAGALAEAFLAAGKRVLFLKDVPTLPYSPRSCERDLPLGLDIDCHIPRESFDKDRAPYLAAVATLAQRVPALQVVDPTALFCDAQRCNALHEGQAQYQDEEHVNVRAALRIWQGPLQGALQR